MKKLVAAMLAAMMAAAALALSIVALNEEAGADAVTAPDGQPAEATAIDRGTWLVRGEIDPKEGLFVCENGVSSVTPYTNDLIVICRD